MTDLLVRIKMFGAFRVYVQDPFIELKIPYGITISELKKLLAEIMKQTHEDFDDQLIQDSVIASQDTILLETAILRETSDLAILPPVCGG